MGTQAVPSTDLTVFPSTLNVSPQNPTPHTKVVTEQNLESLLSRIVPDGVLTGLNLTYTTGLDITVVAGTAIIEGHFVEVDANQTFTFPDASTRRLYLVIDRDGNDAVQGADLEDHPDTDPGPPDSILLGTVVTAGGNITWAYAEARGALRPAVGTYLGDGTVTRLIDCGFTPSYVIVTGETTGGDSAITAYSAMRTPGYRLVEGEDHSGLDRLAFYIVDTDFSFKKPAYIHYQEQWDYPGNLGTSGSETTLHVFTVTGALPGMLVTVAAPALDAFTSPYVAYRAEVTEVDTVTVYYTNTISSRNPADLDYDFNLIGGLEETVTFKQNVIVEGSVGSGKIPVVVQDGFRVGLATDEDLNTNNHRYHYIAFP